MSADKTENLKVLMSDLVNVRKETQTGNLRRGWLFLSMAKLTASGFLDSSDPIWKKVCEAMTEYDSNPVKSSEALEEAIKFIREIILQSA